MWKVSSRKNPEACDCGMEVVNGRRLLANERKKEAIEAGEGSIAHLKVVNSGLIQAARPEEVADFMREPLNFLRRR